MSSLKPAEARPVLVSENWAQVERRTWWFSVLSVATFYSRDRRCPQDGHNPAAAGTPAASCSDPQADGSPACLARRVEIVWLERISKPDHLRSYARQSVDFSEFVHRLATVATVLKCALLTESVQTAGWKRQTLAAACHPVLSPGPALAIVVAGHTVENFNSAVDGVVESGLLTRVPSQTDITFSNSLIESWWRAIKHQRLYLNTLDTVATIRKLVAFYIDQHNTQLPHSAFRGQTPDEMCMRTGSKIPKQLIEKVPPAPLARTSSFHICVGILRSVACRWRPLVIGGPMD